LAIEDWGIRPHMRDMKQILFGAVVAGLLAVPAVAEETPQTETEDGFSLMEEGARLLMRGLMTEIEPTIDELRQEFEELGPALDEFAQAIGPAFAEILGKVDDLGNYAAPEILPNGDIIIRRKPDAPAWLPDPDTGEVEL